MDLGHPRDHSHFARRESSDGRSSFLASLVRFIYDLMTCWGVLCRDLFYLSLAHIKYRQTRITRMKDLVQYFAMVPVGPGIF